MIQVYDIANLSEHELEEYFEQVRNGGGAVSRLRIVEAGSHAIIKFEKSSGKTWLISRNSSDFS